MSTVIAPIERYRTFDRFNKLVEDMLGGATGLMPMVPWSPAVDVKRTAKELTFNVELPGLEQKDVEVEVDRDVLTIFGRREMKKEERREDYVRIERHYGNFQRSFTLDGPVKPEEVVATFKNGVLSVTVPRIAPAEPKKVLINKH